MIKLPPIMDYREAEKHVISPKNKEWFAQGANWMRAEVQRLNATAKSVIAPEWTNEQCLEFLSIAFRHANISGDIEMDDIRLGIRMVNAAVSEKK